jgi:hypothetical protein
MCLFLWACRELAIPYHAHLHRYDLSLFTDNLPATLDSQPTRSSSCIPALLSPLSLHRRYGCHSGLTAHVYLHRCHITLFTDDVHITLGSQLVMHICIAVIFPLY